MEIVTAALGGYADRGAAGLALLGIEVVGGDGDAFDRVRRRDVGDEVRQPAVIVDGAVNARGVAVLRVAVYVHRQGARRVAADGVLFLHLGSAGNHCVEFLVIAALRRGDRQLRDLRLVDFAVDLSRFGLQFRRSLGSPSPASRPRRCRVTSRRTCWLTNTEMFFCVKPAKFPVRAMERV